MIPRTALIFVALGLTTMMAMTATPASAAQDLTDVDEIVQRANLAAYYPGDDGRARVRMTITDQAGRERIRQFTILRRDQADG